MDKKTLHGFIMREAGICSRMKPRPLPRPKRKAIPVRVKRAVCERQNGLCTCGCGAKVEWTKHRLSTRFDHTPSIFLRLVNDAGDDYVPPQNEPDYIVARCLASDGKKTHGGKLGTVAGSDINAIAKQRKRERKPKMKRRIANRGFAKKPDGYKHSFGKRRDGK